MDTPQEIRDVPLTLAAIESFRKMLDIMEEFIRNTEKERIEAGET